MAKAKWYRQAPVYLLVAVVLSLGVVAVPSNILADGKGTFFSEDFEGGLPGDWAVVYNPVTCVHPNTTACCPYWTDDDPCNQTALDGCSGTFMIADSDCCWPSGGAFMDTKLRTPSIDCSGHDTVILEFDHYFLFFIHADNEKGDVDISSDGGANWTNVLAYRDTASGHVSINISAQAAGESDVMIRWRYYDARFDYFWEVDNVKLSEPLPVGGEAYPIDKTSVLAPWIAVAVLLAGGMSWYALRRRRAYS
jgi:hypothetical protein